MYKGKSRSGIDFFNLLMESSEFNQELGRITLAAGRLEAELIRLYKRKGINDDLSKYTLGKLIQYGEKKKLLNKNLVSALDSTCKQRNYITHNVYALFSDLIDETMLPKNNILDSDVWTYTEKAWETNRNLIDLAEIISKEN